MNQENETGQEGHDETVEELRADLDHTRHEIDQTISEIEERLAPDQLRDMMSDRLREVTSPWRERPGEQAEALSRELMTRVREMAWMNPVGLGLAAVTVGYLTGRRSGRRRGR